MIGRTASVLLALNGVAVADRAPTRIGMVEPPPGASTGTATTSESRRSEPRGLALGVELGEPSSGTIAYYVDRVVVSAALGSGTLAGPGLSLHVDAQLVLMQLGDGIPLRAGIGARYYHHGYEPASFDEVPDSHYGVRASLAVALQRGPVELYAEVAPGIDARRTASCTLESGASSVCPHAMERPFFLQLVLGARWFLSH